VEPELYHAPTRGDTSKDHGPEIESADLLEELALLVGREEVRSMSQPVDARLRRLVGQRQRCHAQ
jgi:hypothetical protein